MSANGPACRRSSRPRARVERRTSPTRGQSRPAPRDRRRPDHGRPRRQATQTLVPVNECRVAHQRVAHGGTLEVQIRVRLAAVEDRPWSTSRRVQQSEVSRRPAREVLDECEKVIEGQQYRQRPSRSSTSAQRAQARGGQLRHPGLVATTCRGLPDGANGGVVSAHTTCLHEAGAVSAGYHLAASVIRMGRQRRRRTSSSSRWSATGWRDSASRSLGSRTRSRWWVRLPCARHGRMCRPPRGMVVRSGSPSERRVSALL